MTTKTHTKTRRENAQSTDIQNRKNVTFIIILKLSCDRENAMFNFNETYTRLQNENTALQIQYHIKIHLFSKSSHVQTL